MNSDKIKLKKEILLPELEPYVLRNELGRLVIDHPLFFFHDIKDPYQKNIINAEVNSSFKDRIEQYQKYLKEKNYEFILDLLPKSRKIPWFIKHYRKIYKDLGEEGYYKQLAYIFRSVDYGHQWYRKKYSKLISHGNSPLNMMSEEDRGLYDNLPEKFRVYCGTSSKKKVTTKNLKSLLQNSWSLDREISVWFSFNYSDFPGESIHYIILCYEVYKSEVVSFFLGRGGLGEYKVKEREVFLDYTIIDLERVSFEEIDYDEKYEYSFMND
jgi:hypothetical protein